MSQDVRAVVTQLAEDVHAAGGRALLVGGCVRDRLLGLPVKDFDVEVFGLEGEALEAVLGRRHRLDDVGRSFGVLKLAGWEVDVSLPRRETKIGRGHKGFAIEADPNLSLRDAALRRDLTLNALYEDPRTGEILDPLGGRDDLDRRILRHCSSHFDEDPLRVLRVMQMAARFEASVHDDTIALCRTIDLAELPRERVQEEWRKLFERGRRPSLGLQFLDASRASRFVPELETLRRDSAIRAEQDADLDRLATLELPLGASRLVLGLALLGRRLDPGRTGTLRPLLERLTGTHDVQDRATALVRQQQAGLDGVASDSALRRVALEAPWRDVLAFHAARGHAVAPLKARLKSLGVYDVAPQPWVQGRHLVERGLPPGPEFGRLLTRCFDAQLDGAFDTLDGGLTYLDDLLSRDR